MSRVFRGERVAAHARARPVERLLYRGWAPTPPASRTGRPTRTTLVFSALFSWSLYLILRTQGIHPLNPEGYGAGRWDLSFNTAVVVRLEHELAVLRRRDHPLLLLADGRAGRAELRLGRRRHRRAVAVIRGFASRGATELGNFWQDLIRTLLYVLVPLSFLVALFFVSQGVIQTLSGYVTTRRSQGATRRSPSARPPRRSRSSSWAPTAAASST